MAVEALKMYNVAITTSVCLLEVIDTVLTVCCGPRLVSGFVLYKASCKRDDDAVGQRS